MLLRVLPLLLVALPSLADTVCFLDSECEQGYACQCVQYKDPESGQCDEMAGMCVVVESSVEGHLFAESTLDSDSIRSLACGRPVTSDGL